MKFKQEAATFHPVTITLETAKEVEILHAVLGHAAGGGHEDDLLFKLYSKLGNVETGNVWRSEYRAEGNIRVKKKESGF